MLKERYIIAVLDKVPESQRNEVRIEIDAAIDEMVDQRIEMGEPADLAAEEALNELGDPAALAASYQDRPRYLIGPGWYPAYISALKRIPTIVLPVIATITLLVGIGLEGETITEAIQGSLGSVFFAAVQILFWITLGFIIAERVVGPEMPSTEEKAWTVAELPNLPSRRQITVGDLIADLVVMAALAILALLQYTRGVGFFVRGAVTSVDDLPLTNPDLAWGWHAGFFGVIAFSVLLALAKYVRGFWTLPVTLLGFADSALWAIYVAALAVSAPIINPDVVERLGWGDDWAEPGGQANMVIVAIVVVISVQTAWEAWSGHREYRRLEPVSSST